MLYAGESIPYETNFGTGYFTLEFLKDSRSFELDFTKKIPVSVPQSPNLSLFQVKDTLWEGGVRGSSCIWSPLLKEQNRVSNQMMNVQDWLQTLYSAAGEFHQTEVVPQSLGLECFKFLCL